MIVGLIFVIIFYFIVKNYSYLTSLIIYLAYNIISTIIKNEFNFKSLIIQIIWGAIFVKIYSKIVDMTDSFFLSLIIMSIIDFLALLLISSLLVSLGIV